MTGPKNTAVTPQSDSTFTPTTANNVIKAFTEEHGMDKDAATALLRNSEVKLPKQKVVTIEKTAVQLIKTESDLKKLDDFIAQQKIRYDKLAIRL